MRPIELADAFTLSVVACACGPSTTAQEAEFVVHVTANGDVLVEGELVHLPGGEPKPLRIVMYEASIAMPQVEDDPYGQSPCPDGTVVVIAPPEAPFGSIVRVVDACRLKGIGVWKIELALGSEGGAPTNRLLLVYPRYIGITCYGGGDHFLQAVLLEAPGREPFALSWGDPLRPGDPVTGTLANDELVQLIGEPLRFDLDPSTRVLIEMSAADVASIPAEVLDTNYVCLTAPASAAWGDVFAVLSALRERGIEDFELFTR